MIDLMQKLIIEQYNFIPKNFINDYTLNEGLIKSYNIKDCINYLNNELRFPAIKHVEQYSYNPYYEHNQQEKPTASAFIGIQLNMVYDYLIKYQDIIQVCQNLLGWFTSKIKVTYITKKGDKRTILFDRGESYIPPAWMDEEKHIKKIKEYFYTWTSSDKRTYDFRKFLKENYTIINEVELVIEEKFSREYNPKEYNKNFWYHYTTKDALSKILKQGLIPKSKYNYPDRIYLHNYLDGLKQYIHETYPIEKIKEMLILKLNLNRDEKLYLDPRLEDAVFTYDNISPEEINEIIEDI